MEGPKNSLYLSGHYALLTLNIQTNGFVTFFWLKKMIKDPDLAAGYNEYSIGTSSVPTFTEPQEARVSVSEP